MSADERQRASNRKRLKVFVLAADNKTTPPVDAVFSFLELEGVGDQARLVGSLDVVEVLRRRRDVGVAHPFLDAPDVGLCDHPRAERVAKVVEAQRPETSSLQRGLIVARQCGGVEIPADDAWED